MKNINHYLKNHKNDLKDIIFEFNEGIEFSSHDFIEKFSQKHESDYIEMLEKYKNTGHSFQTVHGVIALYLSRNMTFFNIVKTQKKESENVHGEVDNIQWWMRLED